MGEGTVKTQSHARGLMIKRPRLTGLLDDSEARVLLLLAPAGYGKTTLAREWIEDRHGVAWYNGGPAMADVAALAAGVAEALTTDEVAERVRILAAGGQPALGLAKAVAAAVASDAAAMLVIDDYHYAAESADSNEFLSELLSLTRFRLLLTSRIRPPWLTPRMTVYGEATIIETADLAFTDEEAEQVLSADGSQTPGAIVSQARGWPAVIGLAAKRGGANKPEAGLQPDDLYEYFAEDLFRSAPVELRNALFLLALGGDASAEIARELLGAKHDALVAEAAERGFVTRGAGGAVAIHPLLRGFLLTKLGESNAKAINAVVRSVVTTLADHEHWDECLVALQRFTDAALVVLTLRQALEGLLKSGRVATLKRWIELATGSKSLDPIVMLADAEVALREGKNRKAQMLGERIGELLTGDAAARGHILAARAAHFLDDQAAAQRNWNRAQTLAMTTETQADALWIEFIGSVGLPTLDPAPALARFRDLHDDGPHHAFRLLTGECLILLAGDGDAYASAHACEQAAGLLPHIDDPLLRTNFLNQYSYLMVLLARYEDALVIIAQHIAEADTSGLEFAVDHALVGQANAEIGLRRLLAARRTLDRLRRRVATASDHIIGNSRLKAVKIRIATGDLEGALMLVQSGAWGAPAPGLRDEFRAYEGLLLAAIGDAERAKPILGEGSRSACYIGASAISDLGRAIADLQSAHRGSADGARRTLMNVIGRGYLDGVVTACRAFPDLALIAADDLEVARALTGILTRSRDIDLGRRAGLDMPREFRRNERLSRREQDVYELLAHGRTNREIANALFISESTTKVHVRHIFEKLGVHTRAEAAGISVERE